MGKMLSKAITYATEKHKDQKRKGKSIPYIVHPLEVMNILYRMVAGTDEDLLVAGLLHDVVEDARVPISEIEAEFGSDVASLVAAHSEDKSKSWEERKEQDCQAVANAEKRVQMLVLADKLSNIRDMAQDYTDLKEKLWERFNRGKDKQAWYYRRSGEVLAAMGKDPKTAWAYKEYLELLHKVFDN